MAIDDNASYELTGYQVKDLAQKIRAKADSSSLASVATSGLYSDLTGAPTIPTVYNGTLTIQQNGTTLGTFSANQSTNETINITGGGTSYTAGNGISIDANNEISIDDTVVAELVDIPGVMTGATSSAPGIGGTVPAPAAGDNIKFLAGDGTWKAAGGASVTYYIADGDPNYPAPLQNNFVYEDSARTIKANASDVYANMQAGKTVFLEYRTGMSSGSDMRTTVYTLSTMTEKQNVYVSDQYDYYGSMTAYMDSSATATPATIGFRVEGTEPRAWVFYVSTPPSVYNGTLTIKHNGTNVQTFTANSSTNKTANIETIYADTVAPISTVGAITTNNLADAAVTSAKIDWSTVADVNYSQTEQATGGTWIDGKPIYKKTFVVPIPSSGNSINFQHGISNLGFYVKAEGVIVGSNGVTTRFLPDFYINNNSLDVQYGCAIYGGSTTGAEITITYGSWYYGGTAYVTLWYTKSS